MISGVEGIVFTVTGKVCAADVPHELFALTVIFPPVAFAVVLILDVVEFPDHPPGNVQV